MELKENLKIRWVDNDHVWIDGVQFVSLKRAGEMIRERMEGRNRSEDQPRNELPMERYKLILRHDMVDGIRTYEIDPPCVVEFCALRGQIRGAPCVIDDILERMLYEVRRKYAEEPAP